MTSYIIRRLLLMFPTLLGVTAVVFLVMAYSPGGVGGSLVQADGEMDSKAREALRDYYNRRYGLDELKIVQYGRWLNKVSPIGFATLDDGSVDISIPMVKMPDLGESFSKRRPVIDLYREALPITLLLNVITTPLIYVVSIASGVYMARHRGGLFDVVTGVLFLALWSIPTIWSGIMLIGFLSSKQYVHWFPTGGLSSTLADQWPFFPRITDDGFQRGWLLDRAWHLVQPVMCLTYGGFAFLSKLSRSALLENLSADFVRTARAKGVDDRSVLWQHAFRNSLLPLITVAAGFLPALLAGSVVVEKIFSIPGMGMLTIDAIYARDRELVLAGTLVGGLLSLACILVADIAYAIADPRVSYE
ncbi:MAG: ABC transporter permease [Phycisphaeraceae bacterium]|nr:ABC transporter permease [Phycisphaeraceae bacterium]